MLSTLDIWFTLAEVLEMRAELDTGADSVYCQSVLWLLIPRGPIPI